MGLLHDSTTSPINRLHSSNLQIWRLLGAVRLQKMELQNGRQLTNKVQKFCGGGGK